MFIRLKIETRMIFEWKYEIQMSSLIEPEKLHPLIKKSRLVSLCFDTENWRSFYLIIWSRYMSTNEKIDERLDIQNQLCSKSSVGVNQTFKFDISAFKKRLSKMPLKFETLFEKLELVADLICILSENDEFLSFFWWKYSPDTGWFVFTLSTWS